MVELDRIEVSEFLAEQYSISMFKDGDRDDKEADDWSDDEWGAGEGPARLPRSPYPRGDALRSYFLWWFMLASVLDTLGCAKQGAEPVNDRAKGRLRPLKDETVYSVPFTSYVWYIVGYLSHTAPTTRHHT